MKKTYIIPQTEVVLIKGETLMAPGSVTSLGGDTGISQGSTYTPPADPEEDYGDVREDAAWDIWN